MTHSQEKDYLNGQIEEVFVPMEPPSAEEVTSAYNNGEAIPRGKPEETTTSDLVGECQNELFNMPRTGIMNADLNVQYGILEKYFAKERTQAKKEVVDELRGILTKEHYGIPYESDTCPECFNHDRIKEVLALLPEQES